MRRLIRWFIPKKIVRDTRRSRWHHFKILSIVTVGLSVISSIGVLYTDREKLIKQLHQIGAEAGLKLRYIKVRGRSHIEKETLLSGLDLKLDTPIFRINLKKIHNDVSQIGWVKNVVVERRFPSTIFITLEERVPIALLQTDASHQLIDVAGEIIRGADPRNFTHLKVVAGANAAPNAAPILEALQTEPELFSEVWAINYRSERRWDVHLKSGLQIRLPETDPILAWSRLAVIDRERAITNRDLAVIDLRMPKQLVIEPNLPVRGKGGKT